MVTFFRTASRHRLWDNVYLRRTIGSAALSRNRKKGTYAMKLALVVAVAVLTAMPIMAEPPAAVPVAAKPAEGPEKICHTLDPAIGSNLPRRTCKTRAQWDEQAAHDRATTKDRIDVDKFRDMSAQYSAPH
jgi:hypothetical protein